jgi:hypothetical protein
VRSKVEIVERFSIQTRESFAVRDLLGPAITPHRGLVLGHSSILIPDAAAQS